jgi:hypothetical protein
MAHRMLSIVLILAFGTSSVGCRSADITLVEGHKGPPMPQPTQVVIFDFRTDEGRITLSDEDESPQRVAANVSRALSLELIDQLKHLNLRIVHGEGPMQVPEGAIAIHGELRFLDEGSSWKRGLVGFGYGASLLDTTGRLYMRGPAGPQQIAEYQTEARSGKKPGILTTLPIGMAIQGVSLVVFAINAGSYAVGELSSTVAGNAKETADEWADSLEEFFRQEGWLDD